jgi:hypothetical protein
MAFVADMIRGEYVGPFTWDLTEALENDILIYMKQSQVSGL